MKMSNSHLPLTIPTKNQVTNNFLHRINKSIYLQNLFRLNPIKLLRFPSPFFFPSHAQSRIHFYIFPQDVEISYLQKKESFWHFKTLRDFLRRVVRHPRGHSPTQLRRALSSVTTSPALLSAKVDSMHHHLRSYYENMDLAAVEDVAQCLYPEWRNSHEKPFLWLADLHPYLFTNLLRSFLDDQESEDGDVLDTIQKIRESREFLDERWHIAVAWRSPSKALTTRVDQIECGLRLMVPALTALARLAQMKLVRSVGDERGTRDGVKAAVEEALAAEMEELVGVVVDANRLRKSVLADILSVTSVYQAALFLKAFAEFLVGFRDEKLLKEFDKCKMGIN